ncbi:MAG: hypothetical protein L0154_11240 [Chloroflexi bacterium]|nr:hypothetical protein [Chloroflexota bacterium]
MKKLAILAVFVITIVATYALAQDGGRGNPVAGNRLFSDDFATFVNRWETIDAQDTSVQYDNQALHFVFSGVELEAVSQPSNPIVLPRFIMQTGVAYAENSATDGFGGIAFGYQDADNYYVYGIQPTGHYEVRLRIDGEWQEPLVRGFVEELTEPIQLGIQYDAGRYVLFINEERLVPFFDDNLASGEFGLYASAETSDTHVIFDDFVVFDLLYEGEEPEVTPTMDNPPTDTPSTPTSTPQPTSTVTPEPTMIPSSTPDPDAPAPTPVATIAPPRI